MSLHKRKESLDFLRTFAIWAVLAVHALEQIYAVNVANLSQLSLISRIFAVGTFTLGRLGVPIFLMLTGYLLLPRHYDEESCLRFWKKNWLPMAGVTMLWNAGYNIFITIFNNRKFEITQFLREILFLKKPALVHMWYMMVIIGIYLFIPLLSMLLEKLSFKLILLPIGVVTFFLVLVPSINTFLLMIGKPEIQTQLAFDFSGSYYGVYLIIGYLFAKIPKEKYNPYVCFGVAILSYLFTVFYGLLQFSKGKQFNLWYHFIGVFVCTICIFSAFVNIPKIPISKVFYHFSKNSFGIYLIHLPLQMALLRYANLPRNNPFSVVLMWVAPLIVSDILVTVLSKIPKIGKRIFLMK